ncbi:hypothetical protein K0M31_012832 [Melipona bicolor]|uniref:DUF5641 domain-containing protein n=1 Tax=Melipona bicolor TaxID=60889 RepID=A0AA40FJA5_9HYME|nr:hypothetical protein K0M31_012832 [Melipona bicolor]
MRTVVSLDHSIGVHDLHANNEAQQFDKVPKSERLPPLRWKLSRNAALTQGEDGIARVLSVEAADGLVKRPTAGECILPVDEGGGHAEN